MAEEQGTSAADGAEPEPLHATIQSWCKRGEFTIQAGGGSSVVVLGLMTVRGHNTLCLSESDATFLAAAMNYMKGGDEWRPVRTGEK